MINANEEVINSPEEGGPLYLTGDFLSAKETIYDRIAIEIS